MNKNRILVGLFIGFVLITSALLMIFQDRPVDPEPINVYLFEAGGCPFCEKEYDYLINLSTFKKKFNIVRKELYIDHIAWEKGKDYELGKKVAEKFNELGFDKASYHSTPLVIIGDQYAASGYNGNLEQVINKVYTEGEVDIVNCIDKNIKECTIKNEIKDTTVQKTIVEVLIIVFAACLGVYALVRTRKNKI